MANFSAADVKRLRDLTGAGMMDCKRALEEADGDFEKAVEILRVKGNKDAGKRAERTTAEGMVATSGNALIEINSETDFVAKNAGFQALAAQIAEAAAGSDGTVEAVLAATAPGGSGTIADAITELSARIGEKLVLNRVAKLDAPTAVYLHRRSADLPPAIGVLVAYTGDGDDAAEAARGAAMQISALKATYVSRDAIPADVDRVREADRRGDRPQRGQAGGRAPQDRRGPAAGVLQGRRADRAVLGAGQQEDRRRPAERGRRDRDRVRPIRGRYGLTWTCTGRLVRWPVRHPPPVNGTATKGDPMTSASPSHTNGTATGAEPNPTPGRRRLSRVVLKLGGEMFGGGGVGVDPDVVSIVARQIAEIVQDGVQVAVVIGGGNFFRGAQLQHRGMDRARADYMGMLGTVMNCLALQDFLEREHHIDTRVQTAITMGQVAEPYIPRRAIRHLEKGRVVIFGAGVGMPYFSTDTTAAQRALEIGAEAVLMAKAVDGVYDADPRVTPDAVMFGEITHREVLERGLQVADATAFSLCMDNEMPIVVFNLLTVGNIAKAVRGERIGTLVYTR